MNPTPHIRFPAEGEPQSGVQLTWPHAKTDWRDLLDEVIPCFVAIANEIAKRELLLIVCPDADEVRSQLGAGINLATLPWCVRGWQEGYRVLIAEFTARDIAAIPVSDGKFRVRKCRIVGEVDLVDLGLIEAPEPQEATA